MKKQELRQMLHELKNTLKESERDNQKITELGFYKYENEINTFIISPQLGMSEVIYYKKYDWIFYLKEDLQDYNLKDLTNNIYNEIKNLEN